MKNKKVNEQNEKYSHRPNKTTVTVAKQKN